MQQKGNVVVPLPWPWVTTVCLRLCSSSHFLSHRLFWPVSGPWTGDVPLLPCSAQPPLRLGLSGWL